MAERTRREQIQGGIGIPVSAILFSAYAFSALATKLETQPLPAFGRAGRDRAGVALCAVLAASTW